MNSPPSNPGHLQGWERVLSIGAGLVLTGAALQRRVALPWVAAGLLCGLRGVRGHCRAKALLEDPAQELQRLAARLHGLAARIERMSQRLEPARPVGENPLAPERDQLKRYEE
ncbi:hypothetical protein [Pseudomonas sp. Pseusp97]|uniref:hypothetical protein n=1 Tax=Pseudomonas sp. Pseusp97 TaxID=3243065 RepID=UPI0039A53CF4